MASEPTRADPLFVPVGANPAHVFGLDARTILTGFMAALLGLALSEAAYMAEIVRAGMKAVDPGQQEAAHALGMRVIIDWVANHTAWDNTLTTTHPEWYVRDSQGRFIPPPGTNWSDVIELDYSKPELRAYMIEAMQHWVLETGIDAPIMTEVVAAARATFRLSAMAVISSWVNTRDEPQRGVRPCLRKIASASSAASQSRKASACGCRLAATRAAGYTMSGCDPAGKVASTRTRGSAWASLA